MEQVKPEVIGYIQTEFKGVSLKCDSIIDAFDMMLFSETDFNNTGIKSKFRPVYKKESK